MPQGELYINNKDAYDEWGVSLEDNALATLMTPPAMKDYVKNESRLEHGTRYLPKNPKTSERTIDLPMHLVASSRLDYFSKYLSFCEELKKGTLDIRTAYQEDVIYHCLYQSCSQIRQYIDGLAIFSLKLIEPNCDDRTFVSEEDEE